jgi:mono/diheme cytochrome c family protein
MMRRALLLAGVALVALGAGGAVSQKWLEKVPAADRAMVNPYHGQAEAIAAGQRLFDDHCAACHGSDLLGRRGKPSLRSPIVQGATDGELFWLLKNGDLRHGMPSWSGLPEPERWQIVAYVKSVGEM